jgi:hypothetical protein
LSGTPGNRQISLSWPASLGALTYQLGSSTLPNGPFAPLAGGLTATSYQDTNAVSGQTNYYEIAAANECKLSGVSPAVGIFLPKPNLSVSGSGPQTLNVSWPGWANDWGLFFATNLTPPVQWLPTTNAVGSNNGQFHVIIPIRPEARFFRLISP